MSKAGKHRRRSSGALSRRQFEALVDRGIEELPAWVQDRLENVAFLVQDWPTPEQLQEGGLEHPQDLFGLYEGVPLVARRIDDVLLPDRITIFRGPILAACSSPEEVATEVLATVRHEVAHFLGMEEAELERLESR